MTVLKIKARYGLYNPLKYSAAKMNAIPGIGNPIKSFVLILSAITLYLVNLKTPQITMNKLTSIPISWIIVGVVLIVEYTNTAGATPKDTTSDKESIFFPNPNESSLLAFLATQPSTESNMIANIINNADNSKLLLIELNIDKKPLLIFSNDIMSDIAMNFLMFVSSIFMFTPVILLTSYVINFIFVFVLFLFIFISNYL